MALTEKLAGFVVDARYSQIPAKGIENAKTAILDGLGVILAGSREEEGKIIADYVRDSGGKAEASVLGFGFKTSASQAALANGTMAHAIDYDDGAYGWAFHPTAVLLPTILALGEVKHISGKQALEAYAVGFEVAGRLGINHNARLATNAWHQTGVVGTMGTAAAAARVLRLDTKQTRNCLGIAGSLAAGLRGNFGTMAKPLHAGNTSRNGVVAAELAQRGITANESILEDPQGYFTAFCAGETVDIEAMAENIGNPLLLVSPGKIVKVYPACRATHRCIDAALYLKRKHDVAADDIAEVVCATSDMVRTSLIYSKPRTALEARFCLEYCVGRAFLNGEVSIAHFTEEAIVAPDTEAMRVRVHYSHPDELKGWAGRELPETVTVKLKNGKEFRHSVDKATGDPANPASQADILTKYRQCAGMVIPKDAVGRSMEMVAELERVKDIADLTGLMVPAK